ncbi:(deoxy)nucleoside triphosphate pyrophosphohydrolase [Antarcticibacterium sp. 1MA-6-2]|uniref:(deoxy)nucleoside triphosphate pyrophosphohydrolase n=1 Tax=Antarcticibacterium sp. 1MA-6-2 TaxID=2908210 RepID=UPI001F16D0D5|nr:(deoxy)nucleoside triphosphate pyrophosphohydrolase [Antarcticibacterium sp. 1MA-6-2]UJH90399.1 (deoxy)nucleoside triphosphate pyrophosphohydrolase [Antarcticibacterium sp. 1MA-6-2]
MSKFSNLHTTKVTCAIIEHEGKVLCAQRSEQMKHPLKWEFPGGKVEVDESLEECLQREILEELGVKIEILERLPSSHHSYSAKLKIKLIPFRCRLLSTQIKLKEHLQISWFTSKEAATYDWAEADIPVLKQYFLHHNEH